MTKNIVIIASKKSTNLWDYNEDSMIPLCYKNTNFLLNEYYKIKNNRESVIGDMMQIVLSSVEIENYDAVWTFQRKVLREIGNPGLYFDSKFSTELKLCDWILRTFRNYPRDIYLTFSPIENV